MNKNTIYLLVLGCNKYYSKFLLIFQKNFKFGNIRAWKKRKSPELDELIFSIYMLNCWLYFSSKLFDWYSWNSTTIIFIYLTLLHPSCCKTLEGAKFNGFTKILQDCSPWQIFSTAYNEKWIALHLFLLLKNGSKVLVSSKEGLEY